MPQLNVRCTSPPIALSIILFMPFCMISTPVWSPENTQNSSPAPRANTSHSPNASRTSPAHMRISSS